MEHPNLNILQLEQQFFHPMLSWVEIVIEGMESGKEESKLDIQFLGGETRERFHKQPELYDIIQEVFFI